jgi:solute carrier family 39 (zinc transporter), member 1/2/3
MSVQGLAAYALGSSIVDSQADMSKFWTVIAFFALATPVGIFIGYAVSSIAEGTAAAGISALASGASII